MTTPTDHAGWLRGPAQTSANIRGAWAGNWLLLALRGLLALLFGAVAVFLPAAALLALVLYC